MKAEITFKQLYWNESLTNFFLREQSRRHLYELFNRASCSGMYLEGIISEYVEENEIDADGLDELLYDYSVEELAEEFGIELIEDRDEDEDE